MRSEQRTQLMRRVLLHLDAGTTDVAEGVYRNPTSSYTDPDRLAREERVLFRELPLVMGMSCQIPKAGDRFTNDMTRTPILVMRGEDGTVRAFVNACSHRGARVAHGCGHGRNVVCPYHGWTYGLDGGLRGIPDQRNFPGVDRAARGLVPLPAAERNGMIWVVPNPGSKGTLDVAAYLGALDDEIGSFGLERYHHYETREIRQRMNWKLGIDTFLESYHLGALHRNTVAPLLISNLSLFEPFGRHLREVFPRRSVETQRNVPESEWDFVTHNLLVYVLFPNTVFVVMADHVQVWRMFPAAGSADECALLLDFFVPEPILTDSARGHWSRNMDLTIRTVCEEDFPTCEGMQRGFASGARGEVLYGRNEPALAHFQRGVEEAVAAA